MSKIIPTMLIAVFCGTLSTARVGQSPAENPKAGTASVSGRLLWRGQPIEGVEVTIRPDRFLRSVNPNQESKTRTDAEGQYRVSGLSAGSYVIDIVSQEFMIPDNTTIGSSGKALRVAPGEKIENLNLELKRAGVLSGRVVDSSGNPVGNERLEILKFDREGKPHRYPGRMSRTDAKGNYRISGLLEGRYLMCLGTAPGEGNFLFGSRGAYYVKTCYPNAAEESQAQVIEITEGTEITGADITTGTALKGLGIYGRVVDAASGLAVGEVALRYSVLGKGHNGSERPTAVMTSRATKDGDFQISGVVPGKYSIALASLSDRESEYVGETITVEVTDRDLHNVELKVRRGGTVSGVLAIEGTNHPEVLNRCSKVGVFTRPVSWQNEPLTHQTSNIAKINPDGSFLLKGVPPGKANIYLSLADSSAAGCWIRRVEHNSVKIDRDGFEVRVGENITNIRVIMGYGNLSLRGQIKQIGAIPPEIKLWISANRLGDERSSGGGSYVDARGQFVIENLLPGEYELRVVPTITAGQSNILAPFRKAFSQTKQKVTIMGNNPEPVVLTLDFTQQGNGR